MTGRKNRVGLKSIARVSRAQETEGVPVIIARGVTVGTSHSGVIIERPSSNRKKVMARPVDLRLR